MYKMCEMCMCMSMHVLHLCVCVCVKPANCSCLLFEVIYMASLVAYILTHSRYVVVL